MKMIHYINTYEERGGKALFVKELAQSETILTMNNKSESGNAAETSRENFARHVNESDADTLILHDIIDISDDMLESIESKSVITIIHDYYPACERFTLINNRNNLCSGPYANNCIYCYIYKFPIIKFFHRNTQNMLIPLIRPLSPTMKYYSSRLENKRSIMNRLDSIVFPTEKSRKILMRFFKSCKERSVVLPHFQQEMSCSRKKQDKPVFAFIGHDAYHKGFYTLEEALEKLTNKNIRVEVFGEFEYKSSDKRIHYNGPFSHDNIESIMEQFDALIFPSLWPETWGRVISEAASCGKYIIASNLTPSPEILGDYSGLYTYSHNEPKKLAKTINDIYKKWESLTYPLNPVKFPSIEEYRQKLSALALGDGG